MSPITFVEFVNAKLDHGVPFDDIRGMWLEHLASVRATEDGVSFVLPVDDPPSSNLPDYSATDYDLLGGTKDESLDFDVSLLDSEPDIVMLGPDSTPLVGGADEVENEPLYGDIDPNSYLMIDVEGHNEDVEHGMPMDGLPPISFTDHGYLGPGNTLHGGPAADVDDDIAKEHDIRYTEARTDEDIHEADRHAIGDFVSDAIDTFNPHSILGAIGLGTKYAIEQPAGVLYPNLRKYFSDGEEVD